MRSGRFKLGTQRLAWGEGGDQRTKVSTFSTQHAHQFPGVIGGSDEPEQASQSLNGRTQPSETLACNRVPFSRAHEIATSTGADLSMPVENCAVVPAGLLSLQPSSTPIRAGCCVLHGYSASVDRDVTNSDGGPTLMSRRCDIARWA